MDHLLQVAFYEAVWRIIVSVTVAIILVVCLSTGVASAFMIAAHVALLFTLLMVRNAVQLAAMAKPPAPAQPRPPLTENRAAMLTLGCAKVGSAIAAGLSGAALMVLIVSA